MIIMKKINISEKFRGIIFAILMSSVTSSVVSSVVVIVTRQGTEDFLDFWIPSFLRSWPIVFILILTFVPLINRVINIFFSIKKNN